MRWRMDLIEANMERGHNVLKAIELAAESWNSIGGEINRRIKSGIIKASQVADFRAQNEYRQSILVF